MGNKPKYSINENVPYIEEYVFYKTGKLEYYTLKKGRVIDSTFENGNWFYSCE